MDSNITTGMVIGESGASSNEYEHLHLEIRPNENALIFFNPLYFFSPQSLSTIPNEFMNHENGSNPWRIYGYSSESGGSFWENTLDELWVKY